MARAVEIVTPSRLHFGMVNPFARELRLYISAGVAIARPNNTVIVEEDDTLVVEGCRASEVSSRISGFARRHGLKGTVRIVECIPKHIGLGSTTQLLLAAAYGLSLVNNLEVDLVEAARELELGKYSGVGTYVFKHGGFVMDAGRGESTVFPRLITRLEFPEEWAFIVVTPPGGGLDEKLEDQVFKEEVKVPLELVQKAAYYMLELSASVADRDFNSFSRTLRLLQETVGEMFSSYQGGVFSASSAEAIKALREAGVEGVGQSSWGPTVYGVVYGYEEAERIVEKVSRPGWRVFAARPLNKGATVRFLR